MQIRPLDMQVMVPKLQEVANMRQQENQKSALNQSEISNNQDKNHEKLEKSVKKTNEDELLKNNLDARDKGSNEYTSNGKNKSPKKSDKDDLPEMGEPVRNKIDIRI